MYFFFFQAFLETLLSFNDDYKKSQLSTHMWYNEKPADANVFASKTGSGFNKRKDIIKTGNTFHFQSFIYSDIFFLAKYLLPNISMVSF